MRLSALRDALQRARFVFGYWGLLLDHCRRSGPVPRADGKRASDVVSNRELGGYPSNHNYRIRAGRLVPSFKLYGRWRVISSLYPDSLESLLDVGSSKGFFVLDAAARPGCRRAVGIDVHEPFVSLSQRVKSFTGAERASFHLAYLEDVCKDPAAFGGPFQTVLLINTYHYLFWGSSLASRGFYEHGAILSGIANICSDRLIFSSPLEIDDCPSVIAERAAERSDKRDEYTARRFLEAAREFFDVEERGHLGRRPLYLMLRK